MRARGFTKFKEGALAYWYHPGDGCGGDGCAVDDATAGVSEGRTPLVFVHGVGLGPLPYIGFIEKLLEGDDPKEEATTTGQPTIVVELPFRGAAPQRGGADLGGADCGCDRGRDGTPR